MFHDHSRKTANIKKLFSSNSGVIGNHHSKTADNRGVDAAHNTPPGPHEHTPARNSLISTVYASVLVRSTFKRNTQCVLFSNWQSRLRGGRAWWSTSYPRLTASSIKFSTEPTTVDWISLQNRLQLSH
jgi:hypothetical protein